jgi:hypothetical protein
MGEDGLKNRMFDDTVSNPVLLPRLSLFPDGFAAVPLRQALDGLQVFQADQLWEDCELFVDRSAVMPPGVARDDALALSLYTYEIQEPGHALDNIYARLSRALRERSQETHKWKHYLWYLLNAIRKLPVFEVSARREKLLLLELMLLFFSNFS